jgi:hypothetical protein
MHLRESIEGLKEERFKVTVADGSASGKPIQPTRQSTQTNVVNCGLRFLALRGSETW